MQRRAPLPLLLLVSSLALCRACNDIIINDGQCGQSVVSGRTFSFGAELGPRVTIGPPGAPLTLLEVAPGTPAAPHGASVPITQPFACVSHVVEEVWGAFPPSDPLRSPNHAMCVDGLNAAGLSVAVLYQEETLAMAAHDPASPKTGSINFLDLPAFLLARFTSVAEVEAALNTTTQVVWSPRYAPLGRLVSGGQQDAPPLHVAVHDASGATLVVQFRGRGGALQALRNDGLGVLANRPMLQEQQQLLAAWKEQHGLAAGDANNTQPYQLPGDYSSPSRFARMALLRAATLRACWPTSVGGTPQALSPGVVPAPGADAPAADAAAAAAGYRADSPALLAVLGILQSVYLPRGIDDDGAADAPANPVGAARRSPAGAAAGPQQQQQQQQLVSREVTPYTTLRDHTSLAFMYRTGNSLLFRSIDLTSPAAWARPQGGGATGLALLHKPMQPPAESWVIPDSPPRAAAPSAGGSQSGSSSSTSSSKPGAFRLKGVNSLRMPVR